MTEIRTLIRHSTHYLGGRVAVMLLGFVSFPLFTRLFSVAEYGTINLVIRTILMITVLSKMGIQHSVLRFYEQHATSPESLSRFYSTLFFGTIVTAGSVAVLFSLSVSTLPAHLLPATIQPLLILGSLLIFTGGIRSIFINFLRAEERTHLFNLMEILTKAASIVIICLLILVWQRSPRAFIVGSIGAEAGGLLAITGRFFRHHVLSPKLIDLSLLRSVLIFGLPLIVYEFSTLVLDSGDRILVQYLLGAKALGYYAVAYNIANYIQDLMVVPINLALLPLYMKLWTTKGRERTQQFISRSLNYFLLLGVGIITVVTATSRDAVALLASRKYMESHQLLPVLVAAIVVGSSVSFLNAGLCVYNKTYMFAKIMMCVAALNMVLNVLLLPVLGLRGAAVAVLVSYGALAVLTARASFRLLKLEVRYWNCLRYLLAGGVAAACALSIEVGSTVINLVLRSLTSAGIYGCILYIWDPGVRTAGREVLSAVRATSVAEAGVGAGAID